MATPRKARLGEREVTRIGLGTNRLTDTEANRAFLRSAVAAGLDFIDTAHLYTGGESERAIGAALAPFPGGLTVATKAGYRPATPAELRAEIEESFERLRAERIPLLYLHRVHAETDIEEPVRVLAELVEAGRVEHIGLSEVSAEQVARAQAVAPIAAVQNEYNLGERRWDAVIDHCEASGILFVPFYPLRGDAPALAEVAARHGATETQVKLAWLLARSPCVAPIPGTLSLGHLKENLAALDLELGEEDLAALD